MTYDESVDEELDAGEMGEELEAPEEASAHEPEPSLQEQIREALRAEITEFEARNQPVQRPSQGHVPPPVQARMPAAIDAEAFTLTAMDLREELMEDVEDLISDAPPEIRREVRSRLRNFKTLAELQAVQRDGIHRVIADAALGKAYREGKVTSKARSGPSVGRESVHSEPAPQIPSSFRREQEEVCKILGVKLTEAELQSAWMNR